MNREYDENRITVFNEQQPFIVRTTSLWSHFRRGKLEKRARTGRKEQRCRWKFQGEKMPTAIGRLEAAWRRPSIKRRPSGSMSRASNEGVEIRCARWNSKLSAVKNFTFYAPPRPIDSKTLIPPEFEFPRPINAFHLGQLLVGSSSTTPLPFLLHLLLALKFSMAPPPSRRNTRGLAKCRFPPGPLIRNY